MKQLLIISVLLLPFFCKSQERPEMIYKGGHLQLKKDLSDFLVNEIKFPYADTAHIFILKILPNKKNIKNKIAFEIFGENNAMKALVTDFLLASSKKWDYNKLKNTSVVVPLFITTYSKTNQQSYFNWEKIFSGGLPESQSVLFLKPLILHLHCCPSEPNRDF
jgi:hypothetical protein